MRRMMVVLSIAWVTAEVSGNEICVADAKVALDQIESRCAGLLRSKGIDWEKVRREILREASKADSLQDHYVLLVRLLARLRDGHASVVVSEQAKGVMPPWPELGAGPGLFLCRSGKSMLVKSSWSEAEREGVKPGMEVVTIDGIPAPKWIAERTATLGDLMSFSTDQQAFFFACHWGLGGARGSTLALGLKVGKGRMLQAKVTRGNASTVPVGPVFPPPDLQEVGRQRFGKTGKGFGYIHLRDLPEEAPAQMDRMLAAIGNVPGLILDFRSNGGGGTDHDALLGRFVPKGKEMPRAKASPIRSAGESPYGGPIVVIVDAGVRSAGETASGMFKEDGRGYMIGESPTAGMSSSKVTIDLPSKLFSLYVSVASNKARFQGGRGIEGIGVLPHEIVEYDAGELGAGVDTLIRRAEELLADFPQGKVPYRPAQYGWKPD